MAYVSVGAGRLYYEERGEGPALVMAHGVGGNHASWFNQVPTFSQAWRTIVFDHRAFGNSDDPDGLGREAYLDDLTALLDALDIERAHLVGQSMGGGTCAAFACERPDRVASLVVADSLAGVDLPEPHAASLKAVDAATFGLSQAERVLGPVFRGEDPEQTLLYLQIASFNSVTVRTVKGAAPRWSPERLAQTGLPVLYVAGEDDVLCPASLIKVCAELTPGSAYVEIPGAGHSAYFERPAAFNQAVGDFLKRAA